MTITPGERYAGAQLIAHAASHPATLLFLENGDTPLNAQQPYDVVAVEHGYLLLQGGVNKPGHLITLRHAY